MSKIFHGNYVTKSYGSCGIHEYLFESYVHSDIELPIISNHSFDKKDNLFPKDILSGSVSIKSEEIQKRIKLNLEL